MNDELSIQFDQFILYMYKCIYTDLSHSKLTKKKCNYITTITTTFSITLENDGDVYVRVKEIYRVFEWRQRIPTYYRSIHLII